MAELMGDTNKNEAKTEHTDGRHRRSDRSRQKIIDALFSLLKEGNMSPSAAGVAERAGVGLRTVFRHFEEMDSIYNEMTAHMLGEVLPKARAPYRSSHWQDRLMECIQRRAEIYEDVFPIRVCMSLRRYQSDFLMEQYNRDLAMERDELVALLPEDIASDKIAFSAIETALGFQTWRRLREDSGLSVPDAKAVVSNMARRLASHIDVND